MSAKPNIIQVMEHRQQWNDLFWILAENDVIKYKEIKSLEVSQFFTFLEKWKEHIEEKMKQLKNK